MRRFKSSSLSRNMAEVIKEAKANGVIIECRRSNGEVEEELVLTKLKTTLVMPELTKEQSEELQSRFAMMRSEFTAWTNEEEE